MCFFLFLLSLLLLVVLLFWIRCEKNLLYTRYAIWEKLLNFLLKQSNWNWTSEDLNLKKCTILGDLQIRSLVEIRYMTVILQGWLRSCGAIITSLMFHSGIEFNRNCARSRADISRSQQSRQSSECEYQSCWILAFDDVITLPPVQM